MRIKTYSVALFIVAIIIGSESFAQAPPGIPLDDELLKLGYLDVTLLGADPTGSVVSTQQIRDAVVLARDYDLVCFFPSGTYLVDDTIHCMKKSKLVNGTWRTDNHVCQLIGSGNERPLIKLVPGATKFQDANNPMPVFWFYAMSAWGQQAECEGSIDPLCGQSNVNFNQIIKGFDIDLGQNSGAIGIRHAGAQGASIEDIKINATGAYAGLYNPPGQAGGTYNVEIDGGKYGFYVGKVNGRQSGKVHYDGRMHFR